LGSHWATRGAANPNLGPVTVRQRLDQLAAEPPVRDLGYAADQRLVASALLGLQLLADEIDALKAERAESLQPRPFAEADEGRDMEDGTAGAGIDDVVDQLAELAAEVKKLTKAIKRSTGKQKKKPKEKA
jgi:hypothetical protein